MCTRIADRPDGILDSADGRMGAAQAKWNRLTAEDLTCGCHAGRSNFVTLMSEQRIKPAGIL